MKPTSKKEGSGNPPLSEFRKFILAILRRRVFLLSLFLGVIALLIQLILSEFSWPQFYTFGFVFVGFAWSAYQAYRELSLKYQQTLRSTAAENNTRPTCSISFVNGNEYAYSISDPYNGQNDYITKMQKAKKMKSHFDERGVFFINDKVYYSMGKGRLEINIQTQNSGNMPLDVLSMEVDNTLGLNHFRLHYDGLFHNGKKLGIPFHLETGEVVVLQARYRILVNRSSHEALFAADFRALPRLITHQVSVDSIGADTTKKTFIAELKTPSQPLIDLYVKQWREYDQEEYLVLAGYNLEDDI